MAVSSVQTYQLTVREIIEEAFSRILGEHQTGWEARAGLRQLNLLLQSWANKGIHLWTIGEASQALTAGTAAYTLDSTVVDITSMVVRRDDIDLPVNFISADDYRKLANKSDQGLPFQVWVDRQRDAITIHLYLTPDLSTDTLYMTTKRRFYAATAYTQTVDIPERFQPALLSGLAWYLARNRPSLDGETRTLLKGQYDEDLGEALAEDRNHAPLVVRPDLTCYTGRV